MKLVNLARKWWRKLRNIDEVERLAKSNDALTSMVVKLVYDPPECRERFRQFLESYDYAINAGRQLPSTLSMTRGIVQAVTTNSRGTPAVLDEKENDDV